MAEKCEVIWLEEVAQDFIDEGISEKVIIKIHEKLDQIIAPSPMRRTEKIENFPLTNVRKYRFGDHRLFMIIDLGLYTITCIAFLHRNRCYSKKNLRRILMTAKFSIKDEEKSH